MVSFSICGQAPNTRLFPEAWHVCGEVAFTPYALPGSIKLGAHIADQFGSKARPNCVVLENHGVVVGGETLAQAFERFKTLEFTVQIIFVGLWILQESRREWAHQGRELDYGALTREAQDAEPFRSLINPRAARFLKPGDMPQKIVAYCRETDQPAPETPGQFVRCILESLTLLYRVTLEEMEQLIGRPLQRLHIVGGGSQSALLNQFAASATQRQVIAGPAEATAIGNVLLQAVALGHVGSLAALRQVVRNSFGLQTFEPQDSEGW